MNTMLGWLKYSIPLQLHCIPALIITSDFIVLSLTGARCSPEILRRTLEQQAVTQTKKKKTVHLNVKFTAAFWLLQITTCMSIVSPFTLAWGVSSTSTDRWLWLLTARQKGEIQNRSTYREIWGVSQFIKLLVAISSTSFHTYLRSDTNFQGQHFINLNYQ